MTQLCNSDTPLLSLLLDDTFSFFSFLISHPLHLAYLLFFSPYLLSLASFLYPLLLSTSLLLLLALLTISPYLDDHPPKPPEFLGKTCTIVFDILNPKPEQDKNTTTLWLLDQLVSMVDELCTHSVEQSKTMVALNSEERQVDQDANAGESRVENTSIRRREHMRSASEGLYRDGSMRKEKEWKRTLACKLYEERMTAQLCEEQTAVEGAEEMDMLWEAYEINGSNACNSKRKDKAEKRGDHTREEAVEEEEEEGEVGELCCLQALRLSTNKMSFGVGRPNLTKITKVLKGMRMFSQVGRRRSSRKG
ncbi:uncharacterized protein [Typha angustifolia]|uniref:uncharacterized protein n=1 Tax=Typha angustifolia TaxID=59011 RepID=UPI003C2E3A08